MLRADRLQVRMALDVGDEHRHGERRVGVDLLGDLEPVDLEPGLLERVGKALLRLAALGLAEHAVDHRLVAGLQALREHVLGGQRAAWHRGRRRHSRSRRAELSCRLGQRRIADGDHDALARRRRLTRSWKAAAPGWPMISMQFGLAATASLNWLIIVSGAQAENCSLRLTPKRLGGLLGAGLAGQRRPVAGIAAHLHVHRQALAERAPRRLRSAPDRPAKASAAAAESKNRSSSWSTYPPCSLLPTALGVCSRRSAARMAETRAQPEARRRRRRASAARR